MEKNNFLIIVACHWKEGIVTIEVDKILSDTLRFLCSACLFTLLPLVSVVIVSTPITPSFNKINKSSNSHKGSESIFTNIYSNYLFFELDDYTGSQPASSTYGILGSSVINSNVLGVIPINSSLFTTTFDNNSNFIYKKREYFGPVDISRITIKLVNQKGNIVNLHKTDYSFSLQIRSLYNLTNTGRGLRAPGIF